MDLYINIGYPNTASTLFKRQLYSKHSEINYLGIESQKWQKKLNLVQDSKENNILLYIAYHILHSSRDEFNKSLKNLHLKLSEIQFCQNKTNLISFTGFLNPAKQNYHWSLKEADEFKEFFDVKIFNTHKYNFNETFETFSRIKKLFNTFDKKINLKIFFFIRNQSDLFKSYYNHFESLINQLYKTKIKFRNIIKKLNNNMSTNDITSKMMTYFDYNKVYNELLSLFDEKNINILVYEKFLEDNKLFIKKFSNYLEINENESFNLIKGKSENKIWRYDNGDFHKDTKFILLFKKSIIFKIIRKLFNKNTKLQIHKFLAKEIIQYNEEEKIIIKKYFLDENIELSKKINIDLNKLGYF